MTDSVEQGSSKSGFGSPLLIVALAMTGAVAIWGLVDTAGLAAIAAKLVEIQFVYAHRASIWSDLKQQIFLGDDQFVERVQALIHPQKDLSEIPVAQSRPRAKPLHEYLNLEQDRNRAIARAYLSGGYTLREIAAYFNLHYSTVSNIVRKSKSKTPNSFFLFNPPLLYLVDIYQWRHEPGQYTEKFPGEIK